MATGSFPDHVDMPTKVGFRGFLKRKKENNVSARKIQRIRNAYDLRDRSTRRRIKAGERATFILAVRSWAKCSRPYEYAFSRTRWITTEDVENLRTRHLAWWKKILEHVGNLWTIR